MDWLSRYDWIVPTNPLAAMFIGILFSIFTSMFIWIETKDKKTTMKTLIVTVIVILLLVLLLKQIGFYASTPLE